ncbi:hypothetical protein SB778_32180 [Paraburkholderia sp. SIMBA_050]
MEQHVIEFAPPAEGLDGVSVFNTFRLGRVWHDRLKTGDEVFLMWSKKMQVFGRAVVGDVHNGKLRKLAEAHARFNHNQSANPDTAGAAERLIANMMKRYGPHICHENKLTTCIYLRRIE